METKQLSMNKLKDAFYFLKSSKSLGYDNISYNVIKKCFDSLCEPLKYLFNLSIENGVFPDDLKVVRITPISNYRPISVLLCFSKILERIMYNRLYKYLIENNILY